jgi:hypothetical protein
LRAALFITVLITAGAVSATAGGASSPARAAETMGCLQAHHLLGYVGSARVTPTSPKGPAISANFVLIPKLALNSASLFFEKSAAAAKTIASDYRAYRLKQLRTSGLKVTPTAVSRTYTVKNNVIVMWNVEEGTFPAGHKDAARIVLSCIP